LLNAVPATLPLLLVHRARNTREANTPSPTNGGLLPRSPETNFANRRATAQCVPAVVVAPRTPAPCRLASQSISAMSNDAHPELAATLVARDCRQIRFSGPFPAQPEKSPSGIPASSRIRTSPILLYPRKSPYADKLPKH